MKPNGSVRLVELDFAGRLAGFTLPFKTFILVMTRQIPIYPPRPLPEKKNNRRGLSFSHRIVKPPKPSLKMLVKMRAFRCERLKKG